MSDNEIAKVNYYIKKHGYTITELAKELKWSRSKLSSKINGKTDFSRTEMEAVSRLLKESPKVIFFNDELRFTQLSQIQKTNKFNE